MGEYVRKRAFNGETNAAKSFAEAFELYKDVWKPANDKYLEKITALSAALGKSREEIEAEFEEKM